MVNVRFASALQMTMSLSHGSELGHPLLTSTELAEGLNANPTAVRALVSLLVKAGIVESFKGKSGGVRLKKSPERISLKDIYVAVTEESSVFGSRSEIPHRCKVTRNMKNVFGEISESAEKALLKHLGSISLSQVMSQLK